MKLVVAKLPDHVGAEAVYLGSIHLFLPDAPKSLCRMYWNVNKDPWQVMHMGRYSKIKTPYLQEYECETLLEFVKAYGDQVICEGCQKALRKILGNPPFILADDL